MIAPDTFPPSPLQPGGGRPGDPGPSGRELYADLFTAPGVPRAQPSGPPVNYPVATPHAAGPVNVFRPRTPSPLDAPIVAPPRAPNTLRETGLSLALVSDLILKELYLQANLVGIQLARNTRLPFGVIDEAIRYLRDEKCVEVAGGDLVGPASYRFHLTELGRLRARDAFETCRYVGPAPITLTDYIAQCRRQTVAGIPCQRQSLIEAFEGMLLRQGLLEEVGPAVCSGRSIFIYGPPGNGKSMISKGLGRFLNRFGGEIYVPYAIEMESQIITLFDPTVHQTTDNAELSQANDPNAVPDPYSSNTPGIADPRWRRIRRPVITTGGELTLDMLELRYNKVSNFYTAPLHLKANGGVFLIDDFGRQIVSPRELLNRWILPLEERIDYLSLATGKKMAVPFEQLIIFSTNLDPRELVDEAFLRRIRHKIQIGPPERDLFTHIFRLNCEQRQLAYDPDVVDFLYAKYYDQGKPPRSSDPRDLLEIAQSICRFSNQPTILTRELIAQASERFFVQV